MICLICNYSIIILSKVVDPGSSHSVGSYILSCLCNYPVLTARWLRERADRGVGGYFTRVSAETSGGNPIDDSLLYRSHTVLVVCMSHID